MSEDTVTDALRDALGRVIHGKPEVIELLLVAVIAGGHVLLEDVPGVGKTTMAKALARVVGGSFSRVQFTPDLLPSDILGSQVLDPRDGTFTFHPGPLFANVLLADEINRASPRTQSALLEAMNEGQATIDGKTHVLPDPFLVVATQNPSDYQGTYPLPEAQLDRFLVRASMGYPSPEHELRMLYSRQKDDPLAAVATVADLASVKRLQEQARSVTVRDDVGRYLLRIVERTRSHGEVELGVSPRGALAMFRAIQARARLSGRAYASPDDVQTLAVPVFAHRLQLASQSRYAGTSAAAIIAQVIRSVDVPT